MRRILWKDILTDIVLNEAMLKLLIACFLGGILGLERQRHGRVAGLRTHMLVCMASTVLMTTASHWVVDADASLQLAPGRLAAGIMTGMGFIGAGTIIRSHHSVRGLTTSACLWLTAALGVAIGLGYSVLAVKTAFLSLMILWLLGKLDAVIRTESFHVLTIRMKQNQGVIEKVKSICAQAGGRILDISIHKSKKTDKMVYKLHLQFHHKVDGDRMIDSLCGFTEIEKISWKAF